MGATAPCCRPGPGAGAQPVMGAMAGAGAARNAGAATMSVGNWEPHELTHIPRLPHDDMCDFFFHFFSSTPYLPQFSHILYWHAISSHVVDGARVDLTCRTGFFLGEENREE